MKNGSILVGLKVELVNHDDAVKQFIDYIMIFKYR